VGLKRLFQLYPGGLKARVLEAMKAKWDKKQSQVELALQKQIATGVDAEEMQARLAL
jgi:hypothetical protein